MQFDEVELLAPAGKWDVLESVVEAGADAVYLGGKRLNMRMLRPEFNFSPQELIDAAKYLHDRHKKLYITINNLYYENEIDEIRRYLGFLKGIEADALIIQDMAIAQLCREMNLDIPLHASVQMGIGSSAAANFLVSQGFSRAILSKNLSLEEIQNIHKESTLLIEYFAHGDLCVSHTGQCYMSSFMNAASGNRGACIKPCRWKFGLAEDIGESEPTAYFLAHNDLCLYPYLKELLAAGVRSFKIEGRMREPDYIAHLVKIYRQGLDRIKAAPEGIATDAAELEELNRRRIRDFTSGNLFQLPGLESIGSSGQREPIFISTAFRLKRLDPEAYNPEIVKELKESVNRPTLSVKVGSLECIGLLDKYGVDAIILGCEQINRQPIVWDKNSISEAVALLNRTKTKTEVLVETPRIVTENDLDFLAGIKELAVLNGLSGFIVNDYGSMNILKDSGLKLYGGPGLNISNSAAARFLQHNGLCRLNASLELEYSRLKNLVAAIDGIEVMVHGPLCGMVTDLCLPRVLNQDENGLCLSPCLYTNISLYDEYGQKYSIKTDRKCRNYLYYPYDLCRLAQLPQLIQAGLKHIRIDGQYYSNDILEQTIAIYLRACAAIGQGNWDQSADYNTLLAMFPQGLTELSDEIVYPK